MSPLGLGAPDLYNMRFPIKCAANWHAKYARYGDIAYGQDATGRCSTAAATRPEESNNNSGMWTQRIAAI